MTQWKWPRSLPFGGRRAEKAGDSAEAEPEATELEASGSLGGRTRQRRLLVAGAVVLGLVVAALVAFKPLVRSRAVAEAAKRGVELEVGGVSLGWFRATLRDVTVRPREVAGVTARFQSLSVEVSAGLALRSLVVDGGAVEIAGSVDEVQQRLDGWRQKWRKSTAGEGGSRAATTTFRVHGIDLSWRGAFVEGDEQGWRGLELVRDAEGQRVAFEQLALRHPRGSVELKGLKAVWQRESGAERLVEASIAEAHVKANLTEADDVAGAARTSVDVVDGADAARRAAQTASSAGASPSDEDSDKGLARRLPGLDPDRGRRWQGLVGSLIDGLSERLPAQSKVAALWLELERGDQRLHLGPSTLEVKRGKENLALSLTPQGATKGTPLAVQAELPRGPGALRLKVEGGPVSLETLGVREGDFGLVGVARAELGGLLDLELGEDATTLSLRTDAQLTNLAIENDRLAPRPVSMQKMRLRGRAQVDVGGSRYALEELELQVGEASFQLTGDLERGADHVAVRLRGGTPLIACQTLLDSAPRGLLDRVEQTKMQGTLALDVGVEFDSRKPADMKVRWDLKNACRITEVPPSLSPERFSMPWQHDVIGPDNAPFVVEKGPGTPSWTPAEQMSPHLDAAVLVCEDGRFFRHDGFDARAIEASIQANVRAGHFVRGASTVSMQLAKNLYLSREKQLSRKLQEAVLTMLLEQRLEKRQLLELYFNIVELGPGIYGIKQAAEHYFATTPDRLTLAQAFFLVSILPSPTRQFFDAEGNLNPGRAAYVRRLLEIAHERGYISDAELEEGLAEELRFGVPHTHGDEEPVAPEGADFPATEHFSDHPESATGTEPPIPPLPPRPRPTEPPAPTP